MVFRPKFGLAFLLHACVLGGGIFGPAVCPGNTWAAMGRKRAACATDARRRLPLSSTFAIFKAPGMSPYCYKKIGLPRTLAVVHTVNREGVRYVLDAHGGGAADLDFLYSIYPAHFPAGEGAWGRGNFGHGPAHGRQRALDGTFDRPGSLQQLPPCVQSRLLVALATGQGLGVGGAPVDSGRSAGAGGRRRHGGPASGREGLRQSPTSRCGAFQSQSEPSGSGATSGWS